MDGTHSSLTWPDTAPGTAAGQVDCANDDTLNRDCLSSGQWDTVQDSGTCDSVGTEIRSVGGRGAGRSSKKHFPDSFPPPHRIFLGKFWQKAISGRKSSLENLGYGYGTKISRMSLKWGFYFTGDIAKGAPRKKNRRSFGPPLPQTETEIAGFFFFAPIIFSPRIHAINW